MSGAEPPMHGDPPHELRFALAEGDAVDAPDGLRERVLVAAATAREPGRALGPPDPISGGEAFRRLVLRLDSLLADLSPDEWSLPTIRGLDVQGLVGHLIGVEEHFVAVLAGDADPSLASDHVASTQDAALRQRGRAVEATHQEWFDRTTASLAAVADRDAAAAISFYGTTMPLDQVLDTRTFELWIHEEDIRRATGRPLVDPDASSLARMVDLAISLLPVGMTLVGRARPGATTRVVLTGPGGGTWDVNLDGSAEHRAACSRLVVDAAWFCRVVGDREDAASAGAVVEGDTTVVTDLLVGAAALALD